ncbi:glycogen synthase GlgA [Aestuariivirga sp.]|uniref:glycogen synthase GlgA n=1 Tax=Aestuariivirga sp. TaxID=2650926 RepID=UPI0039E52B0A
MNVLSVASEVFPLIKTGGLADVVGALPSALKQHGVAMRVLVPGYPAVMKWLATGKTLHNYADLFGGPARVMFAEVAGMELMAVDAPHLYERPGNPYVGADGKDWPDNALRFAALSTVAADIGRGALKTWTPDVLHLHDWQAALAAVDVRHRGGPRTVVTVHNIAFQGQFPASVFPRLGLPAAAYAMEGLEYYGNVGFLKGGLATADMITTVSPTYAREICTPEFGMGLDGLLRARRQNTIGIVNGIDTEVWNPATDKALAAPYGAKTMAKRKDNKRELEKRFGLEPGDGILHGVVSRLTWQKGLDILANLLDWLVANGGRLAVVGTGEPGIENAFAAAAQRHPGRIAIVAKYDEALSHLVQGGADTMLVPSRFEPCGLTQLYGLRYGCVPVVARTGGLADTVIDANEAALSAGVATGFQFSPVDEPSLQNALQRAGTMFTTAPAEWTRLQTNGMAADVSWERSAAHYADLYKQMKG